MLVLSVETSSSRGSLAVGHTSAHSRILAEVSWDRVKSHSEVLTAKVPELLNRAGVKLGDLDALAVGLGPGSFTGIRIGINFARAMAYSLKRPVLASSSLRILAQPALTKPGRVLAMTSAFRDLVYSAEFENRDGQVIVVQDPSAQTAAKLATLLPQSFQVLGDAWNKYLDLWPQSAIANAVVWPKVHPDAKDLIAALSFDRDLGREMSWSEILPLYVRASEAEEKLRQGLLKPLPKV